ncbi:phage integrase SAM-like domain-containing protein [Dysgonomonas sp. ZJ279]|uniref:phage integrase SAM-like domain-containing protein n=1 Tax=Dysgonomonas sp. ZJ279 TaxID=2709796 RepID=UPI0013EA5C29|nr:phage integrase SAM-like domain-containing protein [Dysgonomonas sp. ZJ279]
MIVQIYTKAVANNISIDNEYLRSNLNKELGQEKVNNTSSTIFWNKWDEYLTTHKVSDLRKKQLKSTRNHLERFEQQTKYKLAFETITPKLLSDLENFLLNDNPDKKEYEDLPKNKVPRKKSQNSVSSILKRFRAFLSWCMQSQNGALIKENPYSFFQLKGEVYGAPICMTKEERDYLYDKEIIDEKLARVRDIFCFQCFVGCRVGDLTTFTKNDIIDDTLVYYPNKTKTENRVPARVPLSNKAKVILEKYDFPDGKLLPYISDQKYNQYIKELFQRVELNRMVTRFNALTMQKEQIPLWQAASSHLARRTFIHILHSKVKDSVIASMSGHVKGSKAFDRYYEVDDNTRQEAIDKYLD